MFIVRCLAYHTNQAIFESFDDAEDRCKSLIAMYGETFVDENGETHKFEVGCYL